MEPEYVANKIVDAVLRDEFLIYLPRRVWIFDFLHRYVDVCTMDLHIYIMLCLVWHAARAGISRYLCISNENSCAYTWIRCCLI